MFSYKELTNAIRDGIAKSTAQICRKIAAATTNADAAGRQEVSNVVALGDYKFYDNLLPLFFDTEVNGTGAITHDATTNSADLAVTANADYGIIQSKQWHSYFSGKAHQPEFTFIGFTPEDDVVKRVGYYSSATTGTFSTVLDGAYLESSNGTVKLVIAKDGTLTTIEQTEWNKEAQKIDWDNFQVVLFDFLYLGGAIFNFYMYIDGKRILMYQHYHANKIADVIFGTPTQPLRAEIRSTGGSGSFNVVCWQVSSMGDISQMIGRPVSIDTGGLISFATAGTEYLMLAIRPTTRSISVLEDSISITSNGAANESYIWRLRLNGTIANGTPSYDAITNTDFAYEVGDGTMTHGGDGYILASGTGASRSGIDFNPIHSLRPGVAIDGTYDVLYLTYTPLQNTQTASATFSILEF